VSSRADLRGLRLGTAASTSGSMIKGRPPRLPQIFQSYDAPLFFVTMCTLHRRKIPSLRIAEQALATYSTRGTSDFNVAVGRYIVMPDHLHLFVRGGRGFAIGKWAKGLKRAILQAFPEEDRRSFWQPGFFDHLLRNDESYAQKWEYVRQNPVRAGLVESAEDWPYQGEIVYIDRA
jgi:REP-associated tyrosine transposase